METHKVDYIQYSTETVRTTWGTDGEITRSPNKFYKIAQKFGDGVMVLSGNPNSKKSLVILTGKGCDRFRKYLRDIISDEYEHGARCSRIDLCVTIDKREPLDKFKDALKRRRVISRRLDVPKSKTISDIDDKPETVYVGDLKKRGRKGIFRAYDKGVELGLPFPLSRFELECKGNIAHSNCKRWLEHCSIGAMIRKSIDIPSEQWWVDIMGESKSLPQFIDDTINIREESEEYRRWMWLFKQVAPALGKAIAEDELSQFGGSNFDRFNQLVERAYRAHKKGLKS